MGHVSRANCDLRVVTRRSRRRTRANHGRRVRVDAFTLLDAPTVGTSLPFETVSLPDSVETDPSIADLEAAATGVTAAGYGIADYGSVIIQGGTDGEEPVSLYADEHVAVVAASDVLPDMDATFDQLAEDIGTASDSPSSRRGRAQPQTWARS